MTDIVEDLMGDISVPEDMGEHQSEVMSDAYENIKDPHWLFETSILLSRLQPLSLVVKGGEEQVSKSVMMTFKKGLVTFSIITGEVKARISVNVSNTSNQLEGTFIIDWKMFYSTLRNSGSKVLVRCPGSNPVITVLGGDVEFDVFGLDESLWETPLFKEECDTQISGADFTALLKRVSSSMALSSRPEDRKVRIEREVAFSQFLAAIYSQKSEISDGVVSLKASDVEFLNAIFKDVQEISYKELPTEYVFKTPFSTVVIPRIVTDEIKDSLKRVQDFEMKQTYVVSPIHMHKVLCMIRDMTSNSGAVFFFWEDQKVWVRASTRSGRDLKFPIVTSSSSFVGKVGIPLSTILTATNLMKSESQIQISMDGVGKMLFCSEKQSVLFGSIA